MKDSFKTKSKGLLGLFFLSTTALASAQESKGCFNINADVVSSYVWRGINQGSNQPNIQPTVSYTNGGFNIGTWGSGNFTGSLKEFDFYVTYAFPHFFSVTLTDYNWNFTKSHFIYNSNRTDHVFEGTLSYAGTEYFPLSASLNTMFFGADKNAEGDNAYSTYVELSYPITSNAKLFLGTSLFDGPAYGTNGFGVTNLCIRICKTIYFSDKFCLPVYGIAGFNPDAENAFLVAGITL
ncbi:MAG: TorF family putative porin [Bacteroidales bacterium]